MARRRITDTIDDADFAVTVEGPDEDTAKAAAEAGAEAIIARLSERPNEDTDTTDE